MNSPFRSMRSESRPGTTEPCPIPPAPGRQRRLPGRVKHRVVEVRQEVAHLHLGHAACAQHTDFASLVTLTSDADDVLGNIADAAHVELRLIPLGGVLDPFAVPSAVR